MAEYDVKEYSCKIEKSTSASVLQQTSGKYLYKVTIETGKQLGAGTSDTGVFVSLVGSRGKSGKLYLQGYLNVLVGNIISAAEVESFIIESNGDLGDVLVVILGNDENWVAAPPGAPWFVNKVEVYNDQSRRNDIFPCYHWIGDGKNVSFTANTTTQNDVANNKVLSIQRQSQLKARQNEYQWKRNEDTGLPSCIDTSVVQLPDDEEFQTVKNVDFTGTAVVNVVKSRVHNVFNEIKDISDYQSITNAIGEPEVLLYQAGRWARDVEFGRQVLNGVNPVLIQKCTKIPGNFPVTNDMVKGLMNRGLTLEEEIKAGHVYIGDFAILDEIPTNEGQYTAAPLCLLYVNGNNQLVPIAIQLKQKPAKDNPIFLPTDNWIDWLLAKMYYQNAQTQFHQLSTHYFSCHAAMEAYSMATMRNLPDPHPIFKLLRPHFRYTMAINDRARATLINDGGTIDRIFSIGTQGKIELIQRASKHYSVHWTNIIRNITKRDVGNSAELPGYYYRDDGVKVWKAMESFVADMINEFYKTDQDVKSDVELQNWASDIHTNGFPGYFGAEDGHGFPNKISSKRELTEYCTLIMFTGSAQHASINFGQYDMYGFVPNSPSSLRLPPPTKKGVADYTTLMNTLPNEDIASQQVSIAHLLSQYSENEIYVGNYPYHRFTEDAPYRLIERYQRSLQDITGDILERNKKLDVPYTYMLPTKIPNSITI